LPVERIPEHEPGCWKFLTGRIEPSHVEDRIEPLRDGHEAVAPRLGVPRG
jgi:hypothetical protein